MRSESEHNIQAAFVDWVLWTYRSDPTFIRPLFFSTLNGAHLARSGFSFARYEKEGFVRGVADILYLQSRGNWSFMALELKTQKRKREKDRGLSDDQVIFLDSVSEVGGLPSVCYGVDEAIEAFTLYMQRPCKSRIPFGDGIDYDILRARPIKSDEPGP